MTINDYNTFVLSRGLSGDFARAAQILGVSFLYARKQTPYFRAKELIAVAFYGSDLTRAYFVRNLLSGRRQPTGMRNPLSCTIGDWKGHGAYNLLPYSLKRDSGVDFNCGVDSTGRVTPGRRIY